MQQLLGLFAGYRSPNSFGITPSMTAGVNPRSVMTEFLHEGLGNIPLYPSNDHELPHVSWSDIWELPLKDRSTGIDV
jgi:hypothetical protein